jgi:hypothetical protein
MPVASADILGAPGLRTAESGARDLRTQLMSAGGAGGNRSGLGDLASVLPEQQLIGQAGNVRTQASIGAAEQERERASINSNMKMGALNTWTGAVGQKSAMKAGALQGFTGLQQNALQAAMQALIQLLGIDASQAAKLGITMGPGGTTTSISAPLGAGLAGV